ncbi:hypothetical protein G5S34_14885 [Herbaspirillum frisingense]|uniref:hypothetical protein n=1 Tax=Herbaspirillum frisingense TaxID=92645 RepID=UPI0016030F46|nr:hypothetical protein [Herbaspirillum frisingense]QNB07919.1 hypothetical protein G5S34_14885 [Herbaspirillum frisingense]
MGRLANFMFGARSASDPPSLLQDPAGLVGAADAERAACCMSTEMAGAMYRVLPGKKV